MGTVVFILLSNDIVLYISV